MFGGDPATSIKKSHPPHPIFVPYLLWPNGWIDEYATIGTEVDLGTGHIVLDVVPAVRERTTSLFSQVYCGHGCPSRLLLSSRLVPDGYPGSEYLTCRIYLWSPYVIGQTIYIFMLWFVLLLLFQFSAMSTGGGLCPSTKREQSTLQFSAHVYCGQKGRMDQDVTWHGVGPRSRPHCAS